MQCLPGIGWPESTFSRHPVFQVGDIALNDYFRYPLPKSPMYSSHYRAVLLANRGWPLAAAQSGAIATWRELDE